MGSCRGTRTSYSSHLSRADADRSPAITAERTLRRGRMPAEAVERTVWWEKTLRLWAATRPFSLMRDEVICLRAWRRCREDRLL